MQALGIAVSVVGASVARHVGIEHHLSHHQQTALVLVANLVSFGVFYVLKYMVFNRLFRVHTLQELDDLVEQQVDTARVSEAARELAAAVAEFDRRSATWTVVPACRPRPVPTLTPARGSR
jgi:hypothetical protein